MLYAGRFLVPMWQEIAYRKRTDPQYSDKQTLPDVLSRAEAPSNLFPNMLAYVQDLERRISWNPDGFTVWRALSGIFAANAAGSVSFAVGSGVKSDGNVVAATEIYVLARNPNVSATTKDLLAYYLRCVREKRADLNVGFISA